MVLDIMKDTSAFTMILGHVRKKFIQWHSITSQKNGILSNTVVRISTLIKPTVSDFELPHKVGLFNIL